MNERELAEKFLGPLLARKSTAKPFDESPEPLTAHFVRYRRLDRPLGDTNARPVPVSWWKRLTCFIGRHPSMKWDQFAGPYYRPAGSITICSRCSKELKP